MLSFDYYSSLIVSAGLQIISAVLAATTIFLFILFVWMVIRYKCRSRYLNSKQSKQEPHPTHGKSRRGDKKTEDLRHKTINEDDEEDENAALII